MGTQDQQQHVELHRKLNLRKTLLKDALPGPVYVPFVGDGDIAKALYLERTIYAADNDEARTAVATDNLPDAHLATQDCDKAWPFPKATEPFTVADFDAYAYPYDAFRQFWEHAPRADRLVVFFTDGQRQAINRTGYWRQPDGVKPSKIPNRLAKQKIFNFYWNKTILAWFVDFLAMEGWRLVRHSHYLRGPSMLYWGAVIEKGAGVTAKKPDPPKKGKGKAAADKPDTTDSGKIVPIRRGVKVPKRVYAEDDLALGAEEEDDEIPNAPGEQFSDEELGINPIRVGKFGPIKKRHFLKLIGDGMSKTAAAAACGINLRTVEKHQDGYPMFAEAVDLAEMNADGEIENALFEAAKSGNVTAAQVWLYNRAPERWADKRQMNQKLELDEAALELLANVLSSEIQDEETLGRVRAGLARIASTGEAANS